MEFRSEKKKKTLVALYKLMEDLRKSFSKSRREYNPKEFKEKLDEVSGQFQGDDQHDAQEFLIFLINRLNDEALGVDFVRNPSNSHYKDNVEFIRKTNSQLLSDCMGLSQTTLRCSKCMNSSSIYDPFTVLSLSMLEEKKAPDAAAAGCIEVLLFSPSKIKELHVIIISLTDAIKTCYDLRKKVAQTMNLPQYPDLFFVSRHEMDIVDKNYSVQSIAKEVLEKKKLKLCAVFSRFSPLDDCQLIPIRFRSKRAETQPLEDIIPESLPLIENNLSLLDSLDDIRSQLKEYLEEAQDGGTQQSTQQKTESNQSSYSIKIGLYYKHLKNRNKCIFCKRIECTKCFDGESRQEIQEKLNARFSQSLKHGKGGALNSLVDCDEESEEAAAGIRVDIKIEGKKEPKLLEMLKVFNTDSQASVEEESVEKMLQMYTSSEELKDEDVVSCAKCGHRSCSTKHNNLVLLPRILMLHIKRFQMTSNSFFTKNNKMVHFNADLDMSDYLKLVDSEELDKPMQRLKASTKYSLFGVINHVGNMQYGHYFSYAMVDGAWFEFNDESARKIEESSIKTSNAYMLFYRIN